MTCEEKHFWENLPSLLLGRNKNYLEVARPTVVAVRLGAELLVTGQR